jgi:hypothetical protein
VRDEKKRGPENGGADRKVILDMAGARAKFRRGLPVFVEAVFAEADVGFLVVTEEVEIMLDQRRARVGVVANAVSAHPGIEHGQGEQKENHKEALCFARTWLR